MNVEAIFAMVGAVFALGLAGTSVTKRKQKAALKVFSAGMVALVIEGILGVLAVLSTTPDDVLFWQKARLALMPCVTGIWLWFSCIYGKADAGGFLTRWRTHFFATVTVPVIVALVFWRDLGELQIVSLFDDTWTLKMRWPGLALRLYCLVVSVIILVNLERTFRASIGILRWRIKFMLLGLGVLFAVRFYTCTQVVLFQGFDTRMMAIDSGALIVASVLMFKSLFRDGVFETEVYPSHTIIRRSLTVLFAGLYLLVVGVLAKVVEYLGGDETFPIKAFVILAGLALLAVLLMSDRVRLRQGLFISRHFQRPLYDYRETWLKFTECTASHFDQKSLCRDITKLVADTFQALSVSVWLVDDQEKLVLGASTLLSGSQESTSVKTSPMVGQILSQIVEHPEPVDIESDTSGWAVALRSWQPGQFPHGGHRICVPLVSGGRALGLMVVGDRVSGLEFSKQDFGMLKCIGDHTAASLLNLRLSGQLTRNREFAAFQSMASFFVHDLKNAASTLNLMLKNLPVHFDDPAFREDTLRGVSKTVDHINNLIGRLSQLRHGLQIEPSPCNLNDIVTSAVSDWNPEDGKHILQNLGSLPNTLIDQDQFKKVVTNLVLNALEAVSTNGEIRVQTVQSDGNVVLSVSDNGVGMTQEFMDQSLFRAFRSTKKDGFGIGLFQSKLIVEAHGGHLSAKSESGKGSTFSVYLPIVGTSDDVKTPVWQAT